MPDNRVGPLLTSRIYTHTGKQIQTADVNQLIQPISDQATE